MDQIYELFAKHIGRLNTVFGWFVGIIGIVSVWWKYFRSIYYSINLSRKLYNSFGDDFLEIFKVIRETVAEIEIRQKLLCSHLKIALYYCDINGNCKWVNNELCEIFESNSNDMHGFGWLSFLHEDDRVRVYDLWLECISKGIPYSCHYRLNIKEKIKNVQTIAYTVKVDTEIVGYLGLLNITS